MSNRDRIARMRDEAEATEREEEVKRKAGAAADPPKRSRSSEPVRLKAVWAVKDGAGEIVATYPYAFKAAAQAEADRRKAEERRDYIVCPHKVPFDA
jgi:hypothetical protein